MNNFDWIHHVYECLESTKFMALSTSDKGGTWTCPLFFAYEKDFTLYAVSKPIDKHTDNIAKNPEVSAAIYSTEQDLLKRVHGIQMKAKATIVPDDEVDKVFDIYYKRSPRDPKRDGIETLKYKGRDSEWKFIKLDPIEIYYFNSELFGHERKLVDNLAISSANNE